MNLSWLPFRNQLLLQAAKLPGLGICFCLAVIGFSDLVAEEPRWKLATGERYQAEISLVSRNLSEYETRTSGLSTETRMEISWQVREVANGVAVIEEKLERIVIQFDAPTPDPAKKIFFDSSDPASATNIPADQKLLLQSVVGATFIVRMRDDGTIESAECTPATLTAIEAAPESSGVRELLAPAALGKLFSDSALVLPGDEQALREGWTVSGTNPSPWGELTVSRRYLLVGEEQVDSKPLLKFTAELNSTRTPTKAEGAAANVAEVATLKQHTGKGEWFFDPAEGFVTSGQFSTKIEADRTYREETMKTSYTRTTTFRLRKLK